MIGRILRRVVLPAKLCFRPLATNADAPQFEGKDVEVAQKMEELRKNLTTEEIKEAKGMNQQEFSAINEPSPNTYGTKEEEKASQESTEEHANEEHEEKELKEEILKQAMKHAKKLGWTQEALDNGAQDVGYTGDVQKLFPRGAAELLKYAARQWTRELTAALEETKAAGKVMDRSDWICFGLSFVLRKTAGYKANWCRAALGCLQPANLVDGVVDLNRIFDLLYKYEGDQSVDMSYYCKRMALLTIYLRTKTFLMFDKSADNEDTWKFLRRQVDALVKNCNFVDWVCLSTFDVPKVVVGLSAALGDALRDTLEKIEKRHKHKHKHNH